MPPGITPTRGKLISVQAARDAKLREALLDYAPTAVVRVADPMAPLTEAAENWPAPGRDHVHPVHLAFATMSVLRHGDKAADLGPIPGVLADRDAGADGAARVEEALRKAASPTLGKRDRWKTFVAEAGAQLDPELRKIDDTWCENGVSQVGNEMVSRVETRLVVSKQKKMEELARAVMPDSWPERNDFFCSLEPCPDRDAECVPPGTGGTLRPTSAYWRGVYQERVGGCPHGWLPDTYLVFTWNRTDDQIILRYELAPRRPGDRTVLSVDAGYIQVDRIGVDKYEVSTVKYLLFDDERVPSGGQTLGLSACQLGWLDYSINQFTGDEPGPEPDARVDEPGADYDAPLQAVLRTCEAEIRQSVSETDIQLSGILRRLRDDDYGLDASVRDMGELVTRAIRDGSRSARGQADLVQRYVELVRTFTQRPGDGP